MKLYSFCLFVGLFFSANAWSDRPLPLHIYSQIEKERILIGKSTQTYLGKNRFIVNTRADRKVCNRPWKSEGYLACLEATSFEPPVDLTPPKGKETIVNCESYTYVTSDKLKAEYGPGAQLQFCRHKIQGSDYNMPTGLLWSENGEAMYRPVPEGFYFYADAQDMKARPGDYSENYKGFEIVHESTLNACPYVDCESPGSKNTVVCLKREITDILSRIENFEENQKVDKLDRYFMKNCKAQENPARENQSVSCTPEDYKLYQREFKRMIEVASTTFDIPRPVLACLAFQESKWNVRAKSSSAAHGLAQLMPITATEVSRRIQPPEKAKDQYQAMSVYDWEHCTDCEKTYDEIQGDNAIYRDAWVRYHNVLLSDPNYRQRIYELPDGTSKKYKEFGIPASFNKDIDRFLPPMAIGGMAVYLKMIQMERSKSVIHNFTNDPLEFWVLMTGAYNTGDMVLHRTPRVQGKARSFNAFLAQAKKESADNPKKVWEVSNHMKEIRACLKKTWER